MKAEVVLMKNKQILNNTTLSEIRSELDDSLGGVNVSIEILKALQVETGHIEDSVVNIDKSDLPYLGLMMNDIQHKLIIINNLLHHELKDLKKHYDRSDQLKQQLYNYVINEQKNTPESGKNQE